MKYPSDVSIGRILMTIIMYVLTIVCFLKYAIPLTF